MSSNPAASISVIASWVNSAPGAIRRFENVTDGPKEEYSVLMFVIACDAPGAEFTQDAMAEIEAAGLLDNNPAEDNEAWVSPHTDPKNFRAT